MLWNWLVYATVFSFVSEPSFSTNVPTLQQSPDLVPCEKGWYHFREKCYRLFGQKESSRRSWPVAAGRCQALGGHLVTIQSKEELDFIVSFLLLDEKVHAWIGLQDRENESRYAWHDGSEVNFTNWRPSEPNINFSENEDCVEMLFLPEKRVTGTWNDVNCNGGMAYICQKNTTKRKISPDPTRCSSDNSVGWRSQESCYHIVKEKKSWLSAEQHCRKHYNGGHLVTVLNIVVDKFLNYIMSDLKEEVWIGISTKEQFQQQWTSGWYVGYNGFSDEDLMSVTGYCVARNKLEEWTLVECSKKLFFVCETSKSTPPALSNPGPEFHCPEDIPNLRDLGGEYCYFIETKKTLERHKANFECERRGGNLASIHSQEENDIFRPFIQYTKDIGWLHIGLVRSLTHDEDFIWSDGSVMDFHNWNKNEPNTLGDKCGELIANSMVWNDINCDTKIGFICAVPKIGPSSPAHKTNKHKNESNAINLDCSRLLTDMDFSRLYDSMVKCVSRYY